MQTDRQTDSVNKVSETACLTSMLVLKALLTLALMLTTWPTLSRGEDREQRQDLTDMTSREPRPGPPLT